MNKRLFQATMPIEHIKININVDASTILNSFLQDGRKEKRKEERGRAPWAYLEIIIFHIEKLG